MPSVRVEETGDLTTVRKRASIGGSNSGYGTICVICLVDLAAPAEKEELAMGDMEQ